MNKPENKTYPICPKCPERRPRHPHNKGFHPYCYPCLQAYRKERRKIKKDNFNPELAIDKPCPKCPYNDFRHVRPGGYSAYCKQCLADIKTARKDKDQETIKSFNKRHYENNQINFRKQATERNKQVRSTVLKHYSNHQTPFCQCCNETIYEFLTIDHIGGGGNKHRKIIGNRNLYNWLIKNNFPKGFRVLCFNCNWAFGHHGACPHNTITITDRSIEFLEIHAIG